MNLLQRIEHWGDAHHPKWLDIARMALGVFLIFKGVEFLENISLILGRISDHMSFGSFTLWLVGHYIVFAHILGGFLLAIGVLTRFACLIQIPILLGAVFFINAPQGWWQPFSELTLSVLVLLALIYFMIIGNGPWSLDWFTKEEKKNS